MRKFTCSLVMICAVAAAAFLGACNKNCNSCSDNKDNAAVKTDAQGTPAASNCSGKCSGSCSGDKKVCPATGATSN